MSEYNSVNDFIILLYQNFIIAVAIIILYYIISFALYLAYGIGATNFNQIGAGN